MKRSTLKLLLVLVVTLAVFVIPASANAAYIGVVGGYPTYTEDGNCRVPSTGGYYCVAWATRSVRQGCLRRDERYPVWAHRNGWGWTTNGRSTSASWQLTGTARVYC